jgi:lipoprotein-releasing system permease protein
MMFVIMALVLDTASRTQKVYAAENKGRDIGILRTMGLTEGPILRFWSARGSKHRWYVPGVVLDVRLSSKHRPDFRIGELRWWGGVWDPSIRGIYTIPAKLNRTMLKAVVLSLSLSWIRFYLSCCAARRG